MSEQKHFDDVFQKPEPNSEFSSHGRGDSHWLHAAEKTKTSVLGFAVALTLSFSVIELVGGLWGNSLALIGDAGHMVTDSASLLFALVARRGRTTTTPLVTAASRCLPPSLTVS